MIACSGTRSRTSRSGLTAGLRHTRTVGLQAEPKEPRLLRFTRDTVGVVPLEALEPGCRL
jgi:hypothetical protein